MNKTAGRTAAFNADSLREALGYSIQFEGKAFCVVMDAESFRDYNCAQIVRDLLLISRLCKTKIVFLISCFPFRLRGGKQAVCLQNIVSATDEMQNCFGPAATTAYPQKGEWDMLHGQVPPILAKHLIAIVPTIDFRGSEPAELSNPLHFMLTAGIGFEKIVIISNQDGIFDENTEFMPQITSTVLRRFLDEGIISGELAVISEFAYRSINDLGVRRVHIVNGMRPNSIITELFTKEGSGTMIFSDEYLGIRQASPADISSINSLLGKRTNHCPVDKNNVGQFLTAAIDDYIVACVRIQSFREEGKSVLSSLAVDAKYPEMGLKLLAEASKMAEQTVTAVFLALFDAAPWWIPSDFINSRFSQLPKAAKDYYAGKTVPSAVLLKSVSPQIP